MKTYKTFIAEATISMEDFVAGGLFAVALFQSLKKGFRRLKSNMNKRRLNKIITSDDSSYKYINVVNKIDNAVTNGKDTTPFLTSKGIKEFGFSNSVDDVKALKKLEKKVAKIIKDTVYAYKKSHEESGSNMTKEGVEFILNNIDRELQKTKYFKVSLKKKK